MMKHGKIRNSGFTLLETLLVVAVLVILLGLSMVGVVRWRDHLKLTELDNAARDIYMAAENRAVLLQNSGATWIRRRRRVRSSVQQGHKCDGQEKPDRSRTAGKH